LIQSKIKLVDKSSYILHVGVNTLEEEKIGYVIYDVTISLFQNTLIPRNRHLVPSITWNYGSIGGIMKKSVQDIRLL